MRILKDLGMYIVWFLLKLVVGTIAFSFIAALIVGFAVSVGWVIDKTGEDFVKNVVIPGIFILTGGAAAYGLGGSIIDRFRGR